MNFEDDLLNAVEERFEKNIQSLKESSISLLSRKDRKKLQNLSEEEIEELKNKLIKHSKIVSQIALDICRMMDDITEKDSSLIESAALLHDVNKVFLEDYDDDHPKEGAKYIKKHRSVFLECKDYEKELICLMIRWHRDDGYIHKDYNKKKIRMIEIVSAADKISKIYKKSIEDCAYSIIKDISSLQKKKVRKAAAVVLLERVKSLNENDY